MLRITGIYIMKIGVFFILGQVGAIVQHVEHVHIARQVQYVLVEGCVRLDAVGENETPLGVPRRESHRRIEA